MDPNLDRKPIGFWLLFRQDPCLKSIWKPRSVWPIPGDSLVISIENHFLVIFGAGFLTIPGPGFGQKPNRNPAKSGSDFDPFSGPFLGHFWAGSRSISGADLAQFLIQFWSIFGSKFGPESVSTKQDFGFEKCDPKIRPVARLCRLRKHCTNDARHQQSKDRYCEPF